MIEHLLQQNFILQADGYKANHWEEIPTDIEYTYVAVVPRKASKYSSEIVAMGQTMVASYFASVRITEEMIDEADIEITEQGYTFNRSDWEFIARNLNGKLPLRIMGVEEGRIVKPQTPIMGIVNTLPSFAWLPAYVETIVQCIMWKMTTVASICRKVRTTLAHYAEETGTDLSVVDYQCHNFGDRGADSPEAAVIAAIAHAALFNGSDCLQTNSYIKKLYKTSKSYTSSIEATEHSVMCAYSNATTRDDFGAAQMAVDRLYHAVERAKNGVGIPAMSVVIDTYDAHRFVSEYMGEKLKDAITNSGGRMIMRPDSGDPTKEPGIIGKILADKFGYTFNKVGRKVLAPEVGVIQGDGIRIDTFEGVIMGWVDAGFSMDNFCLGMGSGVTHDGARDDFSFSVKAIANKDNRGWVSLLKEPKTDMNKKSLTGLTRCREVNGKLEIIDNLVEFAGELTMWNDQPGWKLWFENGHRINRQSFDEVKSRART